MIDNRDYYDVCSATYTGGLRDDRIDTLSYEELINDVTTVSTPASLMHLHSISAAFNCTIQSYIPPTPSIGLGTSPYTVKIFGRNVRPQSDVRLTLMRTSTTVPRPGASFVATHIVLLAPCAATTVQLSDDEEEENQAT